MWIHCSLQCTTSFKNNQKMRKIYLFNQFKVKIAYLFVTLILFKYLKIIFSLGEIWKKLIQLLSALIFKIMTIQILQCKSSFFTTFRKALLKLTAAQITLMKMIILYKNT
ncbi:transmembrane protein, putative (macronuclear) [Tetrahymena thermophila SB210]|uniref:Transmembrane protein, putative n=1 Tax=Tetrahymena thermophila (strain SB210) TaxID=312017 RepID=W7X7C6_TETTS|nr:transmembrane protein, putative [Tetrahymena thermophila SB210]EWS73267.1 transmembrane protein, putative [Tetrahymena thermophila SB210]|eukprot:XP_012654176.1 transmembrane protein, putative [Tetrahymena thermophila SB210]